MIKQGLNMTNVEIYKWLDEQKYQTSYDETGEYKMYFGVDMPKILNDFADKFFAEVQHLKEHNAMLAESEHACNVLLVREGKAHRECLETIQRLERENADFRQRAQLDLQDAQDKVFLLERENERLKNFVKNIHDNYDCDTDQHKYQDGSGCRCCDAKKLLTFGIEGE